MTEKIHCYCRVVSREMARREDVADKTGKVIGWHTVPDGRETAEIEIVIDKEALANWLGRKAMANRSGRSHTMNGIIKARAVNRHIITKEG
jgi:hypothetical protein